MLGSFKRFLKSVAVFLSILPSGLCRQIKRLRRKRIRRLPLCILLPGIRDIQKKDCPIFIQGQREVQFIPEQQIGQYRMEKQLH